VRNEQEKSLKEKDTTEDVEQDCQEGEMKSGSKGDGKGDTIGWISVESAIHFRRRERFKTHRLGWFSCRSSHLLIVKDQKSCRKTRER